PRRHEASGAGPGLRRGTECGAGGRPRSHRRGRGGSGRRTGRSTPAHGRQLRPCRRPAPAGAYRPHPHVRRRRPPAHGSLDRGEDRRARPAARPGQEAETIVTTFGMTTLAGKASALILIDFQTRLMKAIDEAESVVANAARLQAAARLLEVPVLLTEQN